MYQKSLRKADQIRRFTIQPTAAGWEVREEQDSRVLRHACYQDWHRVEHARRAFAIELKQLTADGWRLLDEPVA